MIYLFHGSDDIRLRTKVQTLVAMLHKKKPDALYVRLTEDEWQPDTLAEVIGSQGLFSDKLIVLFDKLLDSKVSAEILEALAEIQKSENVFIFLEGELPTKTFSKLEKYVEKIEEHNRKEISKEPTTLFALADAFGRRDKKALWLEFEAAKRREAAAEEIHGIIFWQLKSMILASKTSAESSGLKPFVYNKSKRYSSNFRPEELENFSREMISMYHDAHRGLRDLLVSLEMFILSL